MYAGIRHGGEVFARPAPASHELNTRAGAAKTGSYEVRDMVATVTEVAHGDAAMACHLWVLVFPIVWATLSEKKEQQIQLAKPIIALLSKEYHLKQAQARPNVVQVPPHHPAYTPVLTPHDYSVTARGAPAAKCMLGGRAPRLLSRGQPCAHARCGSFWGRAEGCMQSWGAPDDAQACCILLLCDEMHYGSESCDPSPLLITMWR